MTRAAILRGLTSALLALVPRKRRRYARVLFAAIEDQWTAVMTHAEAQAYQRGAREGTSPKSAEDAGFERGWRTGYQAAFDQVMAHVGQPARPDDDCTFP